MPSIRTEMMTMAATSVGQWAATVSSRDLLIGDYLWGVQGQVRHTLRLVGRTTSTLGIEQLAG